MKIFSFKEAQKEISDLMLGLGVEVKGINNHRETNSIKGYVNEIKPFFYIRLRDSKENEVLEEFEGSLAPFVSRAYSILEIRDIDKGILIYKNDVIQNLYDDPSFFEIHHRLKSAANNDEYLQKYINQLQQKKGKLILLDPHIQSMEEARLQGEFYIQNLREINEKIKCTK